MTIGLLTPIRRRLRRASSMWPSSSSTIRIVNTVSHASMSDCLLHDVPVGPKNAQYPITWQREVERGSLTLAALGPNPAAVALDDAMHDGQTHTVPLRLLGMKTLKDLKQPGLAGFGYSEPVVPNPIIDRSIFDSSADLQLQGPVRTSVLEAVADQVGEDLSQ